jgi:hypothetical protein
MPSRGKKIRTVKIILQAKQRRTANSIRLMEKLAIPGDIMKCKETEGTSLARNQLAQAQTSCPSRGMHTPRKACISLLLAQLVQEVLALG